MSGDPRNTEQVFDTTSVSAPTKPEGSARSGDGRPDTPPDPRRNRARRLILEWAVIIAAALILAFVVRVYVFQTFYIPSGSMEPTLQIGDRIIVDKLSYHLHAIQRGDIVVFRRPPAENCGGPPVPDLVKRVIGLPGETISARNGDVFVNGHELNERRWLPPGNPDDYTSNFGPLKVPAGDYFMMGDNRTNSCDSRDWGPLPRSYIVGKVVLRIWPFSHITFF